MHALHPRLPRGAVLPLVALLAVHCGARSGLLGSDNGPDAASVDVSVVDTAISDGPCTNVAPPPPALVPCVDAGPAAAMSSVLLDHGVTRTDNACGVFGGAGNGGRPQPFGSHLTILAPGGRGMILQWSPGMMDDLQTALVGAEAPDGVHVEWLCGGAGSTVRFTDFGPSSGTFVALRSLGTCAAAPAVPGTITMDTMQVTVDLPAAHVSALMGQSTAAWTINAYTADFRDGAPGPLHNIVGAILLRTDGRGTILEGLMAFTPLGPDPGAVYCIGSGTASMTATPSQFLFTAGSLRRLGTCATAPARECAAMSLSWGQVE